LFLIGKCFCIRGGEVHRALKPSKFTVIPTNSEREKLQFTGFVDKTHHGGFKHRKFGARFVEHHASEVNEERCVVHVFKKYMTKRDKDSPFDVLYLKPKKVKQENAVWYYKTPAGYNTLSKVVKNLCKEAGKK
jgi:hypothetical protein